MNRYFLVIVFGLLGSNAFSAEKFIGIFSTVTESECNYEIVLVSGGEGTFSESCRREDGSHMDDIEKQDITWRHSGYDITATITGSDEHFEYKVSLPCNSFGSNGATDGMVGYGMEFWRSPIKCK